MKFESHWPKGSGGVSFYNKLLTTDDALRTLTHLSQGPSWGANSGANSPLGVTV